MPSNRLVNANHSARCQHIKTNGLRCGSPARHGHDFCCFHDSALRRNRDFVLPLIEDHASLQLALNKILQALLDKLIDQKTATTLLYGLQIAFANLKQLRGEQRVDDLDRMREYQRQQAQRAAEPEPSEQPPEADQPSDPPAAAAPAPSKITDPDSPITYDPDPTRAFLTRFLQQQSSTSEDQDQQQPTIDIHACADEDYVSSVCPSLPGDLPAIGLRQSAIGNVSQLRRTVH